MIPAPLLADDVLALVSRRAASSVIVTDPAGHVTWVNTRFERITGYTLEEIIGRKPGDFLQGPKTNPETRAKMRAAIDAGSGFHVRILNYHKSGLPYWVEIECMPNRNAVGELTGFVAVQVETSQPRGDELGKELGDADALSRVSREISGIGVWRINLRSKAALWDGAMCEILHVPRNAQAPSPRRLLRCLHPDDRRLLLEELRFVLREGRDGCVELRLLLPNHRAKTVEARIVVSPDAEGRPLWMTVTVRDISRDKQNADALRSSYREISELKAALDEHAIVAVTDAQGKITRVNDKFCRISGYSRDELYGADHRLVNSGSHPKEFFKALWATISAGRVWHGEICNRAKGGELYWVETTIVPFLGDVGKPKQYIAIRTDITARKAAEARRVQLEEQLAQARKLETLGNFAGGIAHDFNNLIAGINGHVELALMDMPPDAPEAAWLRNATLGCMRAAELAKRLLLFARRGPKQEFLAVDLPKLVRETVPIITPTLGYAVSLRIEVEEPVAPVMGEEGQLMQVLMNLCVNAAHAMGTRGGTLTVTVATLDLQESDLAGFPNASPGPHTVLRVADTGCGMDAEAQAHLFEPFYTTKGPEKGTGLGLSVVHGIVSQHRGVIRVQSQAGRGSVFDVFLPPCTTGAKMPTHARNARILVVDDDKPVLDALVKLLRAHGYSVEGHSEPAQALEIMRARTAHFDVLITDQSMPGMSGLELAAEARPLIPNLRTLLISGLMSPLLVEEAKAIGITAQLPKPLQSEVLLPTVRRVLMTHPS